MPEFTLNPRRSRRRRFSVHRVGDDTVFFDHSTQSFLEAKDWGRIFLLGLADGLTVDQLAREVADRDKSAVERIASDINRFVRELDAVDTSNPLSLDNSEIFREAAVHGAIPCRYAGIKRRAGAVVSVGFDSQSLMERFQALSYGALEATSDEACDVYLCRRGGRTHMQSGEAVYSNFNGTDQAVLTAYCKTEDILAKRIDTLFIAHTGAVRSHGRVGLFPGLGLTGKSTLVAGLGSSGYEVLHDDVVPILRDGTAVSLGRTVKLRQGSWPVIESLDHRIADLPVIRAVDGSCIKLIEFQSRCPSPENASHSPIVIVPRFERGSEPRIDRLTPLEALFKFVEAESIFRKPTDARLVDRICGWLANSDCFEIRYPDIHAGLALVDDVYSRVCD